MIEDKAFDLEGDTPRPYAFIQWKGTDVCMDFHCECGAHLHFDGYFAYHVECPYCQALYQMPSNLFPRRIEDTGQTPRVVPDKDDDDFDSDGKPWES